MKDNKNENKQAGINPVAAAVTGVVIGAGAVVADAIAMRDKNNQMKVEKVMSETKEKIQGYKKDLEDKTQEVKDEAKGKMDQVSGKVKELVEVAKEPKDEKK